jgi:hypothetical protein
LNSKTYYKKKQWRPPSKKKKERRKKPKPEEQEGMPQHRHCTPENPESISMQTRPECVTSPPSVKDEVLT